MKILLVSDAQSIHTRRWAVSLKGLGYDVSIASFRNYEINGVDVHVLPSFGLGKLGYFLAIPYLRFLIKKLKPDIVHAQHVTSYGFLCAISKLKPLVVTAWGSDVLVSPQQSFLLKFFVKYALKNCNHITTVASHMNSVIVALGIAEEKISTIPFGVDLNIFSHRVASVLDNGIFKIISTRHFFPVYNVDILITAASILKNRGVNLELFLVGSGPEKSLLDKLIIQYSLEKEVKFFGRVDQTVLPELLSRADVFVTTALSDGNNISLNEAMACGAFPVASQIPANAQWINDGHNGFLFQPGNAEELADALYKAYCNKGLRESAARLNLEIVKNDADWSKCVLTMLDLYSSMVIG